MMKWQASQLTATLKTLSPDTQKHYATNTVHDINVLDSPKLETGKRFPMNTYATVAKYMNHSENVPGASVGEPKEKYSTIIFVTKNVLQITDEPKINYADADCDEGTSCGRFQAMLKSWPPAKPKAAIYMLVGGLRPYSAPAVMLKSLFKYFNDEFQYPVIIFHEPDFNTRTMQKKVDRPNIFYVEIDFITPKSIPSMDPLIYCPHKNELGYRNMCRFQAGMVFTHPIMQDLEYVMRIDSDAELLPPRITYDLFDFMKHHNLTYGYRTFSRDFESCVKYLWSNVTAYAKRQGIRPSFLQCWPTGKMFYNNFDISRLSFWTSREYKDYFTFLDKLGGIYRYRWGDSPIKGLALSLFAPMHSIHHFNHIGYRHADDKFTGQIQELPQLKPLSEVLSCLKHPK